MLATTAPLAIHLSRRTQYISAFGLLAHCGTTTVPFGISTQVSSEPESPLAPAPPAAVQVVAAASSSEVVVALKLPSRTRPSATTVQGESPIWAMPGGVARPVQASATGS